ncbi:Cytochrome P450 monooxygenase [Pseudocercospora fuligena]|uniref:Cytochrome P450 monooxygenase n=1 Tax=Pseudocercospora fuligena TaxID=685502 RepID=A0A8H6VE88_9PEZI|nr:Cytochrome P450 monooxygenase [Pseudocercospora fuligena]
MAITIAHWLLLTIATVLTLFGVVFVTIAIHRLFWDPLRRVPGPRLAAISNVWHAYHVRNGRMMSFGRTLHEKYGPVVRVGPNEVWLNSKDAFSRIYSATQGFEKSSFYIALALNRPELTGTLSLRFPDTLDLLGEFDMERYRLQRRLIGPIYHKRNLLKYEKTIDAVLAGVVEHLRTLSGTEVDLKEWMHIITVECLSAIVLSWSPGYLRAGTDFGSSGHSYLGWRRKSVFGLFPAAEIMDNYSRSLGRLFAKLWGLTFTPPANFKPFFPAVGNKCMRRINAALRSDPPNDKRRDLAYELIELHKSRPEFKSSYLKRMVMTNFGAGHETTTSTLIAVLSMLGSHAEAQDQVRGEVLQQEYVKGDGYANTCTLTYTEACIKEAQRLHPVIGMSLSRTVPANGTKIDGFYFPPGTTVGCSPVALHRNPEIFGPEVKEYRPDRWRKGDHAKIMDRCNLIWGGGARNCPGRALAELIVQRVVSTLIKEFEISVVMPAEEDMPMYFMAMLSGVKACFRARDRESAPAD